MSSIICALQHLQLFLQGSGREIVRGSASCGYGTIGPEIWPKGAVGQISSSSSLQKLPNSCGACIQVGLLVSMIPNICLTQQLISFHLLRSLSCVLLQVKPAGASVTVQIQVIDVCSSCPANEVGLLQPQLWTLSGGQGTQTGADDTAISYRQVREAYRSTR